MEQKILKPFVLHVEDEDHSAYLLSLMLRDEQADIDVLRLCNGEEAISLSSLDVAYTSMPSRPDVVALISICPRKMDTRF